MRLVEAMGMICPLEFVEWGFAMTSALDFALSVSTTDGDD